MPFFDVLQRTPRLAIHYEDSGLFFEQWKWSALYEGVQAQSPRAYTRLSGERGAYQRVVSDGVEEAPSLQHAVF